MILDNLNNAPNYYELHPLFKRAFDYLKSLDITKLTYGKSELRGKDLFVIIDESKLKKSEDSLLEAHNNYIDIQIPISKAETFGWNSRKNLKIESTPYDESKDIIFYKDKPSTYFNVQPKNFIIFFPGDAHAPCIGEESIIKIVIKVSVK